MLCRGYGQEKNPKIPPGQDIISGCGTVSQPDDWKKDKFFGKNQELVDNLRKQGVAIDSNYLEKLEAGDASGRMGAEMFDARSAPYLIPLKAWIYRNDDGSGNISITELNQIIDQLNNLYRSRANIQFYLLCDITEVNNSNFAISGEAFFNTYTANNRVPGAINVHFVINSRTPDEIWAGRATFPWDNPNYACAVIRRLNLADEANTLGHEIGHTLGLYHTHHPGRANNAYKNEDCGDCYQEAVSRSKKQGLFCVSTIGRRKCEVNGDFLCDTEADPALIWDRFPHPSYVANCSYNGAGGTDRWGDQWRPVVSNIMGYAPANCRYYFSPLQVSKMYGYIGGIGIPYNNFAITGPDQLCTGQTASYSVPLVPGASYYTWQVYPPSLTLLSGQGTNTITVEANADYGGTLTVTPDCGGFKASLTLTNLAGLDITGPDKGCLNQLLYYTTAYFPGTEYNWSITNGAIIEGQGTNSVTVEMYYSTGNYSYLSVNSLSPCNPANSIYGDIMIEHDPYCDPYLTAQTDTDSVKNPSEKLSFKTYGTEITANTIDEALPVKDITVYPNPAKTIVHIKIPGNGMSDLLVFNTAGQLVYRKNGVPGQLELNIGLFEPGLYFIYMAGKERTYSKKLIIEK